MSDLTSTPSPQTKKIPLTQGFVAIVDAADYEWLSQWNWAILKRGPLLYAKRNAWLGDGKRRSVQMHRLVLGLTDPSIHIDHIDGNGLNNTRGNLRICTQQENMRNRRLNSNSTSGYKGVSWYKDRAKWHAQIVVNGKYHHLGHFITAEEAARAYDAAAIELHGEFARLNFEVEP